MRARGSRPVARTVATTIGVRRFSGAVPVPAEDNLTLNLYALSYADRPATVEMTVHRLDETGSVERIFQQALTVPARGAAGASLDAPAGQTVSVRASVPAELAGQLPLSLTVVQFFIADGATLPVVSLSPAAFVAVADRGDDGSRPVPPRDGARRVTRTWGLLDVSQGVAAARPFVTVVLQNTGPQPESVTVRIRRFQKETGRLEPLLERTLSVPAGAAVRFDTDEPEGMTVEIAVAGSLRIVPSLLHGRRFLATGETELLLRYGPEDLVTVGS